MLMKLAPDIRTYQVKAKEEEQKLENEIRD